MDESTVLRYISGEANDLEKEEVIRWVDASPENMHEFLRLRKLYDLSIWQEIHAPSLKLNEGNSKTPVRRKVMPELVRIAAILLIGFLAFRIFYKQDAAIPVAQQTLNVPAGQRAELVLADGTRVWLNANTRFAFPTVFDKKVREVVLEGEGFFQVTHNEKQPFIIRAGNYFIKDLGTEFNILSYPDKGKFEVSLLKGSAEVSESFSGKGVLLNPGQVLIQDGTRLITSSITHENYFLWKDGIISFNDEPFPEMVGKLELYFDLDIVVNNINILNYRCTGKFRTKDGVEHILKVLQLSNKFNYTIDDKLNRITIK